MTKYLNPSFSVAMPSTSEYRANWDNIFANKNVVVGVDPAYPAPSEPFPVAPSCTPLPDLDAFSKVRNFAQEAGLSEDEEDDLCILVDQACYESSLHSQVVEFHQTYGQPIHVTPRVPGAETLKMRVSILAEEFVELMTACGYRTRELGDILFELIDPKDGEDPDMRYEPDLVEIADALADIDYVVEGFRLTCGIDGKPIADEVHRSNMSKLGTDGKPVYRADGKVTKGPNYSPPDIAGELVDQGWQK